MLHRRMRNNHPARNALISLDWRMFLFGRFVDQVAPRSVSHWEAFGAEGFGSGGVRVSTGL